LEDKDFWTTEKVKDLIKSEFGIDYCLNSKEVIKKNTSCRHNGQKLEFIWKSIRKDISTEIIESVARLRELIRNKYTELAPSNHSLRIG
jgi:hypothetical protein